MMKNKPFNRDEEHAFWIERHKKFRDGQKAVGHVGESDQLNNIFYSIRQAALESTVRRYNLELKGKNVLDVGCGFGHFSAFYIDIGANLVGIDISTDAVNYCRQQFNGHFYNCAIDEIELHTQLKFDIIHCFDILYHVTDETEWKSAFNIFSNISNPPALWLITEFNTKQTTYPTKHIVKRKFQQYVSELDQYGWKIIERIPLYWFYTFMPIIARRFPTLVLTLENVKEFAAPFLKEKVECWIVRRKTK